MEEDERRPRGRGLALCLAVTILVVIINIIVAGGKNEDLLISTPVAMQKPVAYVIPPGYVTNDGSTVVSSAALPQAAAVSGQNLFGSGYDTGASSGGSSSSWFGNMGFLAVSSLLASLVAFRASRRRGNGNITRRVNNKVQLGRSVSAFTTSTRSSSNVTSDKGSTDKNPVELEEGRPSRPTG